MVLPARGRPPTGSATAGAQHGLVNGGDLVRQRLHQRSVDGKQRVEEMCKADALGFSGEPIGRAVAVEAPEMILCDNFETRFVVAVKDFLGNAAGRRPVDKRERIGTVPLHIDYGDGHIGADARNEAFGH